MKRILFLLTVVVMFFSLTNCEKKDDGGSGNNSNIATQLTASKWKVHYFFYITDQTRQVADYVFTFKTDSSLTVSNATDTYGGGWSVKKDNAGTQFITINVRSLTQIQLLNSDWKVVANDGSIIQLKETTNGTNSDLHLIKQ